MEYILILSCIICFSSFENNKITETPCDYIKCRSALIEITNKEDSRKIAQLVMCSDISIIHHYEKEKLYVEVKWNRNIQQWQINNNLINIGRLQNVKTICPMHPTSKLRSK